jgi:cytidine deaminase
MTDADEELIRTARRTIERRYRPGTEARSRSVGAALRADSGEVYAAVNLVSDLGRASVCAEPIALGRAVTEGEESFETIVAVKYAPENDPRSVDAGDDSDSDTDTSYRVIAPCGVCRELLRDYDPTTAVVVPGEDGLVTRSIAELLPNLVWRGSDGRSVDRD